MSQNAIELYLELMKKVLSFTLWGETGMPLELYSHRKPFLRRIFLNALSLALKSANLQAVKIKKNDPKKRDEGIIWPWQAHTMIGLKRLDNIQFCIENVLKNNIQGDLIETGVWRGGACIFMRAVLAAYQVANRRVFVADSFEGLPEPDENLYPEDKGHTLHREKILGVLKEEVEDNFRKYGLLDDQVVFLKGWFKDTLPSVPSEKFALIRLDGDMYESTMDAMTNLYSKLQAGGYCIIDDYALNSCKQAVDDFRLKNKIKEKIQTVDWSGVYWQKQKTA